VGEIMDYEVISIKLTNQDKVIFQGHIKNEKQLAENYDYYLALRAYLPDPALIEIVPRRVKIAAQEVIDRMVIGSFPGIKLTHRRENEWMENFSQGFQFFKLELQNPYWLGIKESKNVAIYVPGDIPQPQVKLYCVRDRRIRPPFFRDSYEAVENLLNLYSPNGAWWVCVKTDAEPTSPLSRLNKYWPTTFKLKAENRDSRPTRKWVSSGDRKGIEDDVRLTSLDSYFERGYAYREFWVTINPKNWTMRVFLLKPYFPPGHCQAETFEVKLGKYWVEALEPHFIC
jgi:hypothetical protein